MKTPKSITLTILLISFLSCNSKPVPNLQLFSPEAFAFDVGGSWEVNASVNAKGFEQNEYNENFDIKLFFTVDLITPEKDTLKNIFSDSLASNQKIEFIDVPIEAQIELDTTFSVGNYKLVFEVIDKYSKQEKTTEVSFNLTTD
ncbi:MAG: hypothetical protein GY936_06585 [Ignavibacteriae bacterium]|nr:hypothetical protein [Ignavibacteriota bacterium]